MRAVRLGISLILLACTAGTGQAAVVKNLTSYQSDEFTRMVFELDSGLDHRIFTLENPHRLVIDLEQSSLSGSLSNTDISKTPVSSIRSAKRNTNDLRVVFDLNEKIKPRSYLDDDNKRLIIDLYPQNATVRKPTPVSSIKKEETNRDIVIAISAGHGGHDPGAIGVNGLKEKDVVLAIANETAALINSMPGYRAVMIRGSDKFVELRERVSISHVAKADFYLAIHADAHKNSRAKGATIYALSQRGATSEQARLLAEKENSADLIGGAGAVDLKDKDEVLASVLLDLSMTATVVTSLEIGNDLVSSLAPVVNMRRDKVEQAAFIELMSAGIPSLLIETGYITNSRDAKNLNSSRWRKRFAAALVQGVTQWFYERPPHGTWVAWQKKNGGLQQASYVVKRGDTLSQIAERFQVSMAMLKNANAMNGNTIQVGQTLKLPMNGMASSPFREHTISSGETLSQIAVNYRVSVRSIRESNQLNNDTIRVGQKLRIPTT